MIPSFPPAALSHEHGRRAHAADQLHFSERYEKHLNDNLANYGDPVAHEGLMRDLNEATNTTKKGRKFCWCIAVWVILIIVAASVGGTLLSMGAQKRSLYRLDSVAGGTTTEAMITTFVAPYVASTMVASTFSASAVETSDSESEPQTTTTTTIASWPLQSSQSSYPKSAVLISATTTTGSLMEEQTTFAASTTDSRALSTTNTMTVVDSTSSSKTPVHITMVPTSMKTTLSSSLLSDGSSTSTSTAIPIPSASVSSLTESNAISPLSTTSDENTIPAQTAASGLVGFCGTRGMACTGKIKRDPGAEPDEPAALAILEAALATFSSTPTTLITTTRAHPVAASSSSPTSGFDSTATTTVLSPAAETYTRHPIVGACGAGGMACMKRRQLRLAEV